MDLKQIKTASILIKIETNKIKKEHLIRQDKMHILNNILFFKYRTKQLKTTETNMKVTYPLLLIKISNFCICFSSFHLS